MYITLAVLAGGAALWAVNMPHHNFAGVLWQLVAIAVLARAFVVGRRAILTKPRRDRCQWRFVADDVREDKDLSSNTREAHRAIVSHDEQGRTPVERMFN
jgi:hypothetical protein